MKKLVTGCAIIAAGMLTACVANSDVQHPQHPRATTRFTVPEQIARKTVALDKWIGLVGYDEDGDPEYDDVDPNVDPKAMLKPFCSAVWVSKDKILTAFHCVESLGRPPMNIHDMVVKMLTGVSPKWDPTGQPLTYSIYGDVEEAHGVKIRTVRDATVYAIDPEEDLALIQATPDEEGKLPQHEFAVITQQEVHLGDDLHIVGHPSGQWWSYTHGYVSQHRSQIKNASENPVDAFQVSAPVWFGNSGGGAFNARGELVGIGSWILTRTPNAGFFIDNDTCRRFLQKNKVVR